MGRDQEISPDKIRKPGMELGKNPMITPKRALQ